MMSDAGRAAAALLLFFAAGVACVQGGDEAPASSTTPTVNASITGTTTPGARVSTDRGEYSTTANSAGSFTLNVASGLVYQVAAAANGYKTVVAEGVQVSNGQSLTLNLPLTELLAAGDKTYVGSSQCKLCHSTQHSRWSNAVHRFGVLGPDDSPGMLPALKTLFQNGYNLSATSAFAAYGANAPVFAKSGDTYTVTIGSITYPVKYTMGYKWKQRFITLIGDAHYILPIQYNTATSEFVTYNPTDWYTGTTPKYASATAIETDIYKKNSWERKCLGCHSVTGILSLSFSNSTLSGVAQHRAEFVEKGVGCEACHGPGSAHVWGNGAVGDPANPNIVNPSRLSAERRNDLCGQCHARGLSIGKLFGQAPDTYNVTSDTYTLEYWYNGSRTYRPGDTLVQFYTDGGGYWDTRYAEVRSSKSHHQQWNDFFQSGHTAPGAAVTVTCASCHDPHGPVGQLSQLRLSANDNSLCLTCHGSGGTAKQTFATSAAILDHMPTTHTGYNPGGTGAGRCISCHMPYTAASAIKYDIRSHTFRALRPHNTRRFYNVSASETMPNSCQQACHNPSSSLGASFGTGTAAALAAAEAYDSYVLNPMNKKIDSGLALVTGIIGVTGAVNLDDTAGAWVTVDHTPRGVVTGPDGKYALLLDSPGVYRLAAMKDGRESVQLIVSVGVDSPTVLVGQNMTLPLAGGATALVRPMRCMACHGGTTGAQWRSTGFDDVILRSQVDNETYIFSGHTGHAGLQGGRNWSSASCQKCHEARGAQRYLSIQDTSTSATNYPTRPSQSQEQQTCLACHLPHTSTPAPNSALRAYNTTGYGYQFFFDSSYVTTGFTPTTSVPLQASMPYPAGYEASACLHCHNSRQAYGPLQGNLGAGIKTSGSDSIPSASVPHYGVTTSAFFGIIGTGNFLDTFSQAVIRFDTLILGVDTNALGVVIDTPRVGAHADSFGQLLTFQSYVYENGQPRLVTRNSAPLMKTGVRFTCVTCHMYSQKDGISSTGTATMEDAGHTWKLDLRSCGVCHDANYTGNTTNPVRNAVSTANGFGTTWGISRTTGKLIGDNPPAAADYDGNGTIGTYAAEITGLRGRIIAALSVGTGNDTSYSYTSGIGASGTDSAGGIFKSTSSYAYNSVRAKAGLISLDEMRAVWNCYFFLRGDEFNTIGHHNSEFEVMALRNTWRVLGRLITGQTKWNPPGSDW
jgi:predicted CXXCH cytochrome family protein